MIAPTISDPHWMPWASVNLRRNPFGELTEEERADVAVVDVDPIVRFLDDHKFLDSRKRAVQLIGDCGRGKTTRMLVLKNRFSNGTYVYLPEDTPCPAIAMGDPLLIDEAQRLPRRVRRQIWQAGLPMVLSTHRDLNRSLVRFGYRVLTIQIGDGNNADLVHRALNRRIEASRLHDGPVPVLPIHVADQLVARFGTNLRAIEHFLYEQLQRQVDEYGQVRSVDCVG